MNERAFFEGGVRDHREAILALIRESRSAAELREALEKYHDNDIAAVWEELSREERARVLEAIGYEAMSHIVSYLEDAGEYLTELGAEAAADIIEQMDADEALEALEDLDGKQRAEVLQHIEDAEVREELALLDSYGEDEFGSYMSTNFIAIKHGVGVKGAMRTLIAEAAENDNIHTLFVTRENGTLYGAIDLKALIVARGEDALEPLICTTFPYVCDRDRISENIERLRAYSEDLIPVVRCEDHTLLGVITATDMTELVDAARGDDYAKLAALGGEDAPDEPILKSMKKRVPWLVVLLFMGLAVSAVVGVFEGVVARLPMIVAFQSLILGMAGNVGTQSLAVTVRAIGDREDFRIREQLGTILRETRVALLNGIALGLFSFLIVGVYLATVGGYGRHFTLAAAGCVGGAMCFAMTVSGFTGAAIPVTLYRFGVDPAVASGPLITTVNDLVAVVSYYGLAFLLLLRFVAA